VVWLVVDNINNVLSTRAEVQTLWRRSESARPHAVSLICSQVHPSAYHNSGVALVVTLTNALVN
jgi:hypothetical protein